HEQRYSSTFAGDEFFLADHRIGGRRLLPGTAYLEMARAAVQAALGEEGEGCFIGLRDVVWLRPFAVDGAPASLHIALDERDDAAIGFAIYSFDADGETLVHCEGHAFALAAAEPLQLDLARLQAECADPAPLSVEGCYELFAALDMRYGPALRGLQSLQLGAGQVLAQVQLPAMLLATQDDYLIHPTLLDAALQSAIGLLLGAAGTAREPLLPFALDSLDVLQACPARVGVWLRERPAVAGSSMRQIDLDLFDQAGVVCMSLRGFAARTPPPAGPGAADDTGFAASGALAAAGTPPAAAAAPQPVTAGLPQDLTGALRLVPRWIVEKPAFAASGPAARAVVIGADPAQAQALRSHHAALTVLDLTAASGIAEIAAALAAAGTIDQVYWAAPRAEAVLAADEELITAQESGVLLGFRLVKALLQLDYGSRPLALTALTQQAQPVRAQESCDPSHAAVHGFVGSLAKEYPDWQVRLVDLDDAPAWPLQALAGLPADAAGDAWALRNGEWYRLRLLPCEEMDSAAWSRWRSAGVYVIIGGAGGIGEVLSDYLIRHYQARVVWLGRREADAAIAAKQQRLARDGLAPEYLQADASDRAQLTRAYREVVARHGRIHGVIHAAITLADQGLVGMDEERFRASLAAKVDVSVRLAQVFAREQLDFVLFLSSMQSFSKARGQSNYAAGCTFSDAFAHCLGQEWRCPVKTVNWGYWGSVGIVASAFYQQRMEQLGIGSIEPVEAMAALEDLLAAPLAQMAYLKLTRPVRVDGMDLQHRLRIRSGDSIVDMDRIEGRLRTMAARGAAQLAPAAGAAQPAAQLDSLLAALLMRQLHDAGLLAAGPGLERHTARWLAHTRRLLLQHGYLREDGSVARLPDADAAWAAWEQARAQWRDDPGLAAQSRLVDETLRALPQIIAGTLPVTDILFRDSGMQMVEGVYQGHAEADVFNALIAEAVLACLDERAAAAAQAGGRATPLRILEIGAGTGGTSAPVLAALATRQEQVAEYCYTDLSQAFLLHAQEHFAPANPFLRCVRVDAERSLAAQGLAGGSYDIVIATNVLHATRDIRETVRNVKTALKRGGLLLLNEIASAGNLFTHLTFGLTKGWWLFEDETLRVPGAPTLLPQTWHGVLRDAGFAPVLFPAQELHGQGQQVIVALSDGIVVERRAVPADVSAAAPAVAAAPIASAAPAAAATPAASVAAAAVAPVAAAPVAQAGAPSRAGLAARVREIVRECLCASLKLDAARVQDEASLVDYGVDSIIAVSLVKRINERCGIVLPTTIIFDYNTIERLTRHMLDGHGAALARAFGADTAPAPTPAIPPVPATAAAAAPGIAAAAAPPASAPAAVPARQSVAALSAPATAAP
ncbi:SDR family NAD(P)-dependent oxidoreductase, partial [Tahibacter sp. P2K]